MGTFAGAIIHVPGELPALAGNAEAKAYLEGVPGLISGRATVAARVKKGNIDKASIHYAWKNIL